MNTKLRNIFISVFVTILFSIIVVNKTLYFVNYDNLLNLRGFTERPNDIVIIEIDNLSIDRIGKWPWKRSVYADALKKISSQQPKVIGIDLLFLEHGDEKEDKILNDTLNNLGTPVILASNIISKHDFKRLDGIDYKFDIYGVSKPIFNLQSGYTNFLIDEDDIVRAVQLNFKYDNELLKSFPLVLAENVLKKKIDYNINKKLYINYIGSARLFQYISFHDVYKSLVDLEAFKDKTVLIAPTYESSKEYLKTPFNKAEIKSPGIEIMANALNTILRNKTIIISSRLVNIILLFLSSLIILFLFSKKYGVIKNIILTLVSCLIYYFLLFIIFLNFYYYLPIYPIINIVILFIFNLIIDSIDKIKVIKKLKNIDLIKDTFDLKELQIIKLVQEGYSNPKIAKKLFISIKAVKNRLTKIYKKLGISKREDLKNIDLDGIELSNKANSS